jgi:hypothetical protein
MAGGAARRLLIAASTAPTSLRLIACSVVRGHIRTRLVMAALWRFAPDNVGHLNYLHPEIWKSGDVPPDVEK